jgi:galactonate dehydratase
MFEEVRAFCVAPRWIFVRVRTDDGRHGWGEAIVPKRRNAVLGALADLGRELRGASERRIEELWQRARIGAFFRGGPVLATAAAAVEHALWDLKARGLGVPVHDLLGGPVRDRIRLYSWIGGDRPSSLVRDARLRVEQGFTAVKLNATAELDQIDHTAAVDEVLARIAALREEFGTELDIAVDFHGRVHRGMVAPLLRELEQFRLLWVEEPVAPGHESLLRDICRTSGATRIATGERLTSRWEFRDLLTDGAVDVLQPDVSLTGLFELEKICRMAEAFDVPVVPHCPNGPVSLAASLQVAACCLNIPLHEQSIGLHYHRGYDGLPSGDMHDYLSDPSPLTPVAGHFDVPAGPGLGIELDEDVVAQRDGDWELPDARWRLPDGRITEW